jgi:hypothetical protein
MIYEGLHAWLTANHLSVQNPGPTAAEPAALLMFSIDAKKT